MAIPTSAPLLMANPHTTHLQELNIPVIQTDPSVVIKIIEEHLLLSQGYQNMVVLDNEKAQEECIPAVMFYGDGGII